MALPNRKKLRLEGFDYGSEALYFVTSCVQNRLNHFGEVRDGKMVLNKYGEIAVRQWSWLFEQYSYIKSHAFVVMPNHVHGVIEIIHNSSLKIKPLPQLMGAYKTTTSKKIRLAGLLEFKWQKSYHDRIIRGGRAYHNIVNYIEANPERWDEDSLK